MAHDTKKPDLLAAVKDFIREAAQATRAPEQAQPSAQLTALAQSAKSDEIALG